MLNPSQKQRLERQKLERQVRENKDEKKERKKSQWDSPQQKATFNKNMRHKLKDGLRGLSDMVLLLESLPPNVLDNAKLIEDLPNVTKFVEVFLEKADLLPVDKHESSEIRTFRNYALYLGNDFNVNGLKTKSIKIINGEKYVLYSDSVTASASERNNIDILKKHIEHLQRYIDPCIIVIDDKNFRKPRDINSIFDEVDLKRDMIGQCNAQSCVIKENIPTKPPCKPRALVDGKLCEIEEISAPSGK